jgi:O-antigen chain-terminating methyltransferase
MTPDFYRAFEDRFRGSRDEISARLGQYQPLLDALKTAVSSRGALDLGCGRGEWLEALDQNGFAVTGVDTDPGMLAACHRLGLNVQQRDFLDVLRETADDSQAMVSAFHLVEHLPFESVLELIRQAHRVLAPGGLLLMETPNSENIGVGTWNFYLDPTHQRPLPHLLLSFATEFSGFGFVRTLRVNHDTQVAESREPGLLDVLCRASPDYAIIGMKSRADGKDGQDIFAAMLAEAEGLSLEQLARRYDDKYSGAIRTLDAELYALRAQFDTFQEVEAKLLSQFSNETNMVCDLSLERFLKARQTVADRIDKLERASDSEFKRLNELTSQLHEAVASMRGEAAGLLQQLADMRNSTSWRITKPLRLVISVIKRVFKRNGSH